MGARPADVPAQQPTPDYLTANLNTSATLGLGIPPSLQLRANEVIE
jgi:hypothetical protein